MDDNIKLQSAATGKVKGIMVINPYTLKVLKFIYNIVKYKKK